MANDAIPFYEDGDELTGTPTAAVTGKRFVKISGDRQADGTLSIAPAGAGARALGVAMYDAAIGVRCTVHTIDSGDVVPIKSPGALAADVSVKSDATGQAVAAASGDLALGFTLTGNGAGADAQVKLAYHIAP